jgi:hypothetical protein
MKYIFLFATLLLSATAHSQKIENADNCLIWLKDLKPYQTFGMTEDELEVYHKLREKYSNPEVYSVVVQGVLTATDNEHNPIYLVIYTQGRLGYESVNFDSYKEFIAKFEEE